MYKIEALNDIVTRLGGTGGYKYEIQALNAWAVLVGAAGDYKYEIQALNAIDKSKGGTGLHKYNIDALNSICKAAGGSGLNKYEIAALVFIGSNVNYYLLNEFIGAKEAYSQLKVGKTATTSIRVRRSSDNAEQDIGFVSGSIDTASLLAFVGIGDGYITKWYGQSEVVDARQTTALNQPKIVDAGVLVVANEKPALNFDGVADFLNLNSGDILTTKNATFFIKLTAKPVVNKIIIGNISSHFLGFTSTTNIRFRISSVVLDFAIPEVTQGQLITITAVISDLTTNVGARIYVDGVESTTGQLFTGVTDDFTYRYLGYGGFVGSYYEGKILSYYMFDRPFSAQEISDFTSKL
ncbi:MAG: LamG-like jellyroll fold domain-containing protein [Candidatus Auribacterota bacterium]|jgi:hypothetical protein|nr:LamG-like jellyroll fold domain-containing protein [Candidatus Auribacterota bacterium]